MNIGRLRATRRSRKGLLRLFGSAAGGSGDVLLSEYSRSEMLERVYGEWDQFLKEVNAYKKKEFNISLLASKVAIIEMSLFLADAKRSFSGLRMKNKIVDKHKLGAIFCLVADHYERRLDDRKFSEN